MSAAAPPSEHRVVVVGAGIGGLVSALLLACRGLQVTLVEAAATPGGKMRQLHVDGAAIDAGPTVFTMRWVFDEILAQAGSSVDELPLQLTPLAVLARHAWRPTRSRAANGGGSDPSQQRLDLFASRERSAAAIGAFSGAVEARRFLGFCRQAQQLYAHLEGPYIRSPRPSLLGIAGDLGPRGLAVLAGLGPFATLWRSLARHFNDPRLQQLFGRYATYCGASPWAAPATLMLVADVEQQGVWSVNGGLHAVAQAIAGLAQQRGVWLRYGQACEQIAVRNGRVCGVRLAGGEVLAADSVVFNGDTNALAAGLLGNSVQRAVPATPRSRRSLSAVTWALHVKTNGFPLLRHNVFFDTDYASEFDDIFSRRRLPERGTVYVCAQDRTDSDAAPLTVTHADGRERLLALVNAPADGDSRPFDPTETTPCEQRSLALLRDCGLTLDWSSNPQQVQRTTPADFHRLFPATGGALYGRATHGWMSSFSRPSSTTRVPGLYLAGGSVHPGPGVPMAALSGRLAAAALLAHLDSTSRSRRAATAGGTSTPSATTPGTR